MRSASCTILLALFISTPLFANLRAPFFLITPPSSALAGKPSLVVQSEDLKFTCSGFSSLNSSDIDKLRENPGLAGKCTVQATYKIKSNQDVTASFEFILPSDSIVQINGAEGISVKPQFIPETSSSFGHNSSRDPVYNARFVSKLKSGGNTITAEYVQVLSSREYGYGYFQDGKFQRSFLYYLHPLREWTLSDQFTLNISVSTPIPGLWARLFGPDFHLKCGENSPVETKEVGSERVTAFKFKNDFPDDFYCGFTE